MAFSKVFFVSSREMLNLLIKALDEVKETLTSIDTRLRNVDTDVSQLLCALEHLDADVIRRFW